MFGTVLEINNTTLSVTLVISRAEVVRKKTTGSDTLVASKSKNGMGTRKQRHFGTFENANRGERTTNNDTLVTSRAQDGRGTLK